MVSIDNKVDYQVLLEKDFNKKIDLIKDKTNILHFSTGADSVASFKISDIQAILKKHDCKLPIEYKLWGISFETPRAWNIRLIKEHCKETYKQILEYFPLIDYEMYREKYNRLNRHFKTRLSQFSDFAISKQEYKTW